MIVFLYLCIVVGCLSLFSHVFYAGMLSWFLMIVSINVNSLIALLYCVYYWNFRVSLGFLLMLLCLVVAVLSDGSSGFDFFIPISFFYLVFFIILSKRARHSS